MQRRVLLEPHPMRNYDGIRKERRKPHLRDSMTFNGLRFQKTRWTLSRHREMALRICFIWFIVATTSKAEDEPPLEFVGPRPKAETQVTFERVDFGPTPLATDPDLEIRTFHIPAPRSLILSSDGYPLAINRVANRLTIRLAETAKTVDEAIRTVREVQSQIESFVPASAISDTEIGRHFTNRPGFPLALTGEIPRQTLRELSGKLPAGCGIKRFYLREYPQGELFAHLIGYVGVSLPDQHGPIGKVEYIWPPSEGRAGMEMSLDESIRGKDGQLLQLCDRDGNIVHQEVTEAPVPGETIVMSINLRMQRLSMERLVESGRPGAFVAVDADNGSILAMISYPSFDPNLFIGGISNTDYSALAGQIDAPLFDRAVTGAYPPGSTFKPIVALAGMESGAIDGIETLFPGPASLEIGGRTFKNWSSQGEGPMDVRYALVRSCNTWFYQAALQIGAAPIKSVSERLGLGAAPDLPLPSISPGNLPDSEFYSDPRSLANYAIGQGDVLTSPVQMAFAMAGIANGEFLPKARLILERRNPKTNATTETFHPSIQHYLKLNAEDVDIVRDGMWGVVNYSNGTAKGASMRNPVVYGKTGTSQWSTGGELRALAWFTGWVDARSPRIAFAAVTHSEGYEGLSGGRSAAPIASGVLRKLYAKPDEYAVTLPEGPTRNSPQIIAANPIVEVIPIDITPRRPLGKLFRFLFGGGPEKMPPP
jgi:penicillin-binding protein 2